VFRFPVVSGALATLRPGTLALERRTAEKLGKTTGDQITVPTSSGERRTFNVIAVYRASVVYGEVIAAWDDFAALSGTEVTTEADAVLVRVADGVSPERSRERLDSALESFPGVGVNGLLEHQAKASGDINLMIGLVGMLLGFAIVIAFIGIANTVSLSILERTRESAMVRALGFTRGQLYATVTSEAILMAVVGALIGGAFGVVYALITVRVLVTEATVFAVPLLQLLIGVGVAALAGAVAAALPARRAARTSIVSALGET
jgi:putative ABC transport system permease protein